MTIGNGTQVQIGTDSPPVYSAWALQETNRVTNPFFVATSGTNEVRRNLMSNPTYGTAAADWGAAPQWFGSGHSGTTARVTGATDGPISGITAYGRKTWTTPGAGVAYDVSFRFRNTTRIAVVPGEVYTISMYWRNSWATGSVQNRMAVSFWDAVTAGNQVGATLTSADFPLPAIGQWQRVFYTFTVPSGATHMDPFHTPYISTVPPVNATLDATAFMAEKWANLAQAYMDGGYRPRLRENLALDPNCSSASPTLNTGVAGTSTVTQESTNVRGGTNGYKLVKVNNASHAYIRGSAANATTGYAPLRQGETRYLAFWAYASVATKFTAVTRGGSYSANSWNLNPGWNYCEWAYTGGSVSTAGLMGFDLGWEAVDGTIGAEVTVSGIRVYTSPTTDSNDFFSGGTAVSGGTTSAWVGTANNSVSYQYDNSLTATWVGTADASATTLTGASPTGNVVQGGETSAAFWKTPSGARSFVTNTSTPGGRAVRLDYTWVAGNVYTIVLRGRRIGANPQLQIAGNVYNNNAFLNWTESFTTYRYTFTAANSGGTVYLQNTNAYGAGFELEGVGIFDGPYGGNVFSGATPDDTLAQYSWTGSANNSTSTLETRGLISDGAAARWNVANYQVLEDSTPLDPSDTRGGYGQINLTLPEGADTKALMNQPLVLTDGAMGETTGTVRKLGGNGLAASITANSRLANLAVERTIQPFIGTLTDCIEYLLGLCGITSGIVIDTDFDAVNVKVPGGRENVYDRLLQMGASYGFETSLVSNNVVIRQPRERLAVNYRNADVAWEMDQSELAQSIIGWYYNTYSGTHIAYPVQNDEFAADVFQVDANETKVYEIVLDASLSSVTQPVASTGATYLSTTNSRYAVSTMDGDTIDPGLWLASGGRVIATLSEDTKSMTITVTGANLPALSPFRIAVQDANGDFVSALRIHGTGVFWRRQSFTMVLVEDADLAPDEVGVELDVPFMETFDQLYHRMLLTAQRYGTDKQTIRVRTGGINRLGESGSARYATIGDVAAAYPGATISSIYSSLGPTIADWNAGVLALVSGDFANQAYGNVNGARVLHDHSYYRIRSASITAASINYDAERDNTIGDAYRTGETIAQWNSRWSGKTIRDVNIAPLIQGESL